MVLYNLTFFAFLTSSGRCLSGSLCMSINTLRAESIVVPCKVGGLILLPIMVFGVDALRLLCFDEFVLALGEEGAVVEDESQELPMALHVGEEGTVVYGEAHELYITLRAGDKGETANAGAEEFSTKVRAKRGLGGTERGSSYSIGSSGTAPRFEVLIKVGRPTVPAIELDLGLRFSLENTLFTFL